MLPPIDEKMFPNKFQSIPLPTKREIFARVGAIADKGQYTGDDSADFGNSPTVMAEKLTKAAEDYEAPKEDLPE